MTITGLVKNHFRLAAYHLTGNMQMLHQHTKKVKNTMQQITDQSLSLVSVVKLWNMSLQNTYLTIWKATVYYMFFNMASDILDPVKPNYCPLFKNLLQIQIKIFKPISLS
jgi:ATP/ADP translocase